MHGFLLTYPYPRMGLELTFKTLKDANDGEGNSTAAVFIQHLCAEHARGFAIDRNAFLPVKQWYHEHIFIK